MSRPAGTPAAATRDADGDVELLVRVFGAPAGETGVAPSAEQWEAVERAAVQHGLAPLLHRHLGAHAWPSPPPPAVVQRLRDVHVHSALRSAAAGAALGEVLRTLRGAGVEVIVLKGACLAGEVYGEAGLRPMADVDLLVRRESLGRTRALLESIGYSSAAEAHDEAHHHLPAFRKPGAIPVEVHWSPTRSGLGADAGDAMWADARPARIAGVEVLVLAPEALLHHLCVHVAHGHRFWVPLLHLHDLAAVAARHPQLSWSRLESIARASGSTRFVYAALALAARAFPTRFPADVRARIAALPHDAEDDRVVTLVWDALMAPAPDFPRLLARVAATPRGLARARLLWAHLFPSRARMRIVGAGRARPLALAYLVRLGALLRRGSPVLLPLVWPRAGEGDPRFQARRRAVVERWVCGSDAT